MTICFLSKDSNEVAVPGGPRLYQVEAICRGEKPDQVQVDMTQWTSTLSSFIFMAPCLTPQIPCHCCWVSLLTGPSV